MKPKAMYPFDNICRRIMRATEGGVVPADHRKRNHFYNLVIHLSRKTALERGVPNTIETHRRQMRKLRNSK